MAKQTSLVNNLSAKQISSDYIRLSWKWPSDAFQSSGNGFYVDKATVSWRAQLEKNGKTLEKYTKWNKVTLNDDGGSLRNTTQYDVNIPGRPDGYYFANVVMKLSIHWAWVGSGASVVWRDSSISFQMLPPKKPTISVSFAASTGTITFKVKGADDGYKRRRMVYCVSRQDSSNRNNSYKTEKNLLNWTNTSADEVTDSRDITDHMSLSQDQWITLRCRAYSFGSGGETDIAMKEYRIAHPAEATISEITCTKPANGTVTVAIKTNKSSIRPVTQVKLYRLANTTIGTAAQAAQVPLSSWSAVPNAVDDAECSGFTDQKSAAMPEVRKHTWYRVVSTYGANTVEGTPAEATCLYRARDAASADAIKYRSVELGDDGTSVKLALGWATDSYNAVQVSWSDFEDAWESSEQPKTHIMDWEDASPASGYAHSASFTVRGLDSGKPIYIRCRRVLVEDDKVIQHGEWCPPSATYYPIYPAEGIATATIFAPAYVGRGEGIDCSWTLTGASQDSWALNRVDGSKVTLLARGDGPASQWVVPPAKIGTAESVTLRLGVRSGADWVYASDVTVGIADAPTLAVTPPATLTAQPLSVSLESDSGVASVRVSVVAAGDVQGTRPDGGEQVAGDVLWADSIVPAWTAAQSGYTYTLELPEGLAFIDNSEYTVRAVAVDPTTALESEAVESTFGVAWAHQASAPDESTAIVPDADGLTCAITPAAPEDAAETDVCDVYRRSFDGIQLIASGVPFGTEVTDPFAPFSKVPGVLAYTLATRTVDGDLDWADYPYDLAHGSIVIDAGGTRAELPWDMAKSDAWQNSFELESRWDGSRVGRWDGGTTHTASLDTDVVLLDDAMQAESVAAVGRHAGPCFVRTPDGAAFPAHVSVDSYGAALGVPVKPVSLKATEVDMTEEFEGTWEVE